VVLITDTLSCVLAGRCASGFGDGACAMDPFRFKAVAPGARARSLAPPQPAAASALDPRVMGREPRPHVTADRPGRVIPDDDERLLACVGQAGSQPPEILGGDVTDRPPVDNTEPPGLGVRPPHPIAGERWGGGIRRARRVLDQAHRSGVCPGLPVGVGQAAPPDFVLESQGEGGTRGF
jgi:hypothetical protein